MSRVMSISPEVVVMTRAELKQREDDAFRRGVERGRFEESCERSNSASPGSTATSEGASVMTETVELGSAGRPANSELDDSGHPWMT